MRIAIVQDYLRTGGTERQTVALANAFAAAGHAVMVLTFRPGGPLASKLSPSVTHRSLQPFDLWVDWFAPGFFETLRAFRPDIVQMMGRMAHNRAWRVRAALPEARFVATWRTGKSLSPLFRQALENADAVVANCDEAAQRLADAHGIAGPRVHVIRNGLLMRAEPAADARSSARARLGTPPDTLVLISVAMMRPGKGHRDLVRIAAALKLPETQPWELWLVGDGPESTPCRRLAAKLGIAGRVRFLGRQDNPADLIAAADLALLASHTGYEALPNFIVEAQWLGLPTIAYDVGGVAEAMIPGKSGLLVPEGDEAAFAAAIRFAAGDDAWRAMAASLAHEHARREFDPGRQNGRYLELYMRLLQV